MRPRQKRILPHIAVHEAGHAVAAVLFDFRFGEVSIISDDHSRGRVGWFQSNLSLKRVASGKNGSALLLQDSLRFGIVGLSGWAAEQIHCVGFNAGSEADFKEVQGHLRRRIEFCEVLSRAVFLMDQSQVRTAVAGVARALSKHRILSRSDVRIIVSKAVAPKVVRRLIAATTSIPHFKSA